MKAPIALSRAPIASSDWAIAASGERSLESIRRWSPASEIIGIIIPFKKRTDRFYGPRSDRASGWEPAPNGAPRNDRGAIPLPYALRLIHTPAWGTAWTLERP